MEESRKQREKAEQFYLEYRSLLYRTARRLAKAVADSENLVQNSLLRILKNLSHYTLNEPNKTEALIVLTVQFQYIDNQHKAYAVQWSDMADETLQKVIAKTSASIPTGRDYLHVETRLLLESLPAEEHFLLNAHYYAGYSVKGLAAMCGISIGAMNMKLHRAKHRAVEIWNLKLEDVLK